MTQPLSAIKKPVSQARSLWLYRILGHQATWLANTQACRSKQATRATPKGSLRLLCALSPTSRPYLSLGLSIRATFFVDRNLKLTVVSTQTALFVDRCIKQIELSTISAISMDRDYRYSPCLPKLSHNSQRGHADAD